MFNIHCPVVVVQGMGGGSIITMAEIITADLVPLAERGAYQGIIVLVWALAAGVGPVIVSATPLTTLATTHAQQFRALRSPRRLRGDGSSVSPLSNIPVH